MRPSVGSVIVMSIMRPQRVGSLTIDFASSTADSLTSLGRPLWKIGRLEAASKNPIFSIVLLPKTLLNFSFHKLSSEHPNENFNCSVPVEKLSDLAIIRAKAEKSFWHFTPNCAIAGMLENSGWVKKILQVRSAPRDTTCLMKLFERGTPSENIVNSLRISSPIGTDLLSISITF